MRFDMKCVRNHWWVQSGYRREDIKALRMLQRGGSSTNMEMQTVQEMEQLIDEACMPPPVVVSDWDEYFSPDGSMNMM